MAFAERTKVPANQSRGEIEALLVKYKATSVAVFNSADQAAIAFEMEGRRIIFRLALPKGTDQKAEQEKRRKWRALLLSIKAKLASIEDGIESFEDAFLSHIVMPDGMTVGEHTRPRIQSAYQDNKMTPLLPGPKK
jgi:hypothetical protein